MSRKIMIEFNGVHKGFHFWSEKHQNLKSWLVNAAKGKFTSGRKTSIEVIRNVSFQIREGEFVAIMGRNGAGKSTTLKLISGIYEPDLGKVSIHGDVAPLIELGAGFDAELSGYENILLNSAILGFSRSETLKNIDSIIEFSELRGLIDMPIKNYSSGMLVRLGFSIATHLTSPILLIDEVLAVGDIGFQRKCAVKIRELHAQGRTVVLVTHSPATAKEFAARSIVIDAGEKAFDGETSQAIELYFTRLGEASVGGTESPLTM